MSADIFLLLGPGADRKHQKLDELRKEMLPDARSADFDYDALYGHRLDPVTLKKDLMALPATGKRRLIVIHELERLSKQNQDILLWYSEQDDRPAVLILDSDGPGGKSAFFTKLKKRAKVFEFSGQRAETVFDMTRQMSRRDTVGAMKILKNLLDNGQQPLQIMGALIWYWGTQREKVRKDVFKKGLLHLQQADLNIKRSRLKPDQAVEVCIIKLSGLLSS